MWVKREHYDDIVKRLDDIQENIEAHDTRLISAADPLRAAVKVQNEIKESIEQLTKEVEAIKKRDQKVVTQDDEAQYEQELALSRFKK